MAVGLLDAVPGVLRVSQRLRRTFSAGGLATAAAFGSFATCYGSIFASTFLGVQALVINPHVQAIVMWGLGLLAAYALWRDRIRHGRTVPLVIGLIGVLTLIFSLYVEYEKRFEILAYVLLVLGALANQRAVLTALHARVSRQAAEIERLNRDLRAQVGAQDAEIARLGRLKEFLPPSVAELVVAEGNETLLDSHRRYIACLFCDIRDFTRLSERLAPEETMALLRTFHDQVGALVSKHHGTIGHRAGDGYMVFFNDPVPCEAPVRDAVALALEIQGAWQNQGELWRRLGRPVGIGIGIAAGYATLGLVGNRGRTDYTAIGPEVNLAARLCANAGDGQILISRRAYLDVEGQVDAHAREIGPLKGVGELETVYEVHGMRTRGAPALRVVDG